MCLLTARRSIRLLLSSLLFGLLVPLLAASPVAAATFTVTSTADSGAGSLRAAVASANLTPGSTIHIATAGTYTLTSDATLTITADMAIDNTSGGTVIIDGHCTGCDPGGTPAGGTTVFTVPTLAPPGTPTVSISGVTIRHGNGGQAGGIYNNGGTMTLTNVVVSGNAVPGVSFGGLGGGIYNAGTMTVVGSTIAGNSSVLGGGGIANSGPALTLIDTTVAANRAGVGGGGIYHVSTSMNVINSTIAGNVISKDGGLGGGIENNNGTIVVVNSTIAANSAPGGGAQGGGIDNEGAAHLTNTIVAGNTSPVGPEVAGAPVASGGHNLIGKADGSSGWVATDKTGTAAAPLDPKLGSLASNGGPTQTMALLGCSPALDAGDNAAITNPPFPGPPFTDQRGAGFPRIANGTVDIGAFEVAGASPPCGGGGGGGGGTPNCATLTATPNPVPFGGGATDLAWDTCDGSNAEVTVSNNGGPEVDFIASGAPSGHRLTTNPDGQGFIVSGSYIFRLYRAGSHTLLAGVIVQKANPKGTTGPAIVATPDPVPFTPGQVLNQVLIKFDTGDDTPGDVYVAQNGGAPGLFTENVTSPGGAGAPTAVSSKAGVKPATATPTGERADWVQAGTYVFTLRSHATGQVLDSVTVTTQAGLAAAPNPVSGGSNLTGTSTQITFNTGGGLPGAVVPGAVCVANGSNVYVPNTYSNSGAGVSTLTGLTTGTYTAVLYVSASGQPITTVVPGVGGCTANVPLTPAPGIAPVTITVNP